MSVAYGTPLDYAIVVAYFIAILAFGSYFGRYTRTTRDFFLSGQRFAWWLVAFSCIATVVGSYSFIKYSAVGYRYGLSSTMTYLNDWFLAPLFILGWLPIIYFSRVTSIPEYFEKRFDRPTRILAVVFILLYLVGYIGINLYTLGVAMNAVIPAFGVFEWAAIIALVAAVYVTFGGQTAVIMTDLAQGLLLLLAGILLFVLGIRFLGEHNPDGLSGLAAFWKGLPPDHRLPFSGFAEPDKFPMVGIFWQDLFGASMFFYFANQGLIMRFLAVKSVAEGRKAIIAVILFLMPLAAIATGNAGWIGRSMQSFGLIPAGAEPNQIFMVVAELVARPGLFGLVLAALTAALMSTVDTLINAVAAIAINDIYRPFIAPRRRDSHYLAVARVFSMAFTLGGLLLVPTYMKFKSIYVAHGAFTAAISPPMIVVVVLGILWKRFSPRAASATLLAGGVLMGVSLRFPEVISPLATLHGMEPGTAFDFMRALYGFVVCSAVATGVSLRWPARDDEKIRGLWVGSLQDAKRAFKGGEPNDRTFGEKLRLTIEASTPGAPGPPIDGSERPLVVLAREDAERMRARAGDLVYVTHPRWWYGGLRSFHATLGLRDGGPGVVLAPREEIAQARLRPGEPVVVEKIL